MTVPPTIGMPIASCIHPISVTSTRQGSVPFAGGSDTLVTAAVVTIRAAHLVPWCGLVCVMSVNITAARNPG